MNSMQVYGAYLEDYHEIKLIIPSNESFKQLKLKGNGEVVDLFISRSEQFHHELHLYLYFYTSIKFNLDYQVIVNNHLTYPLKLGKVTRSKRFERQFQTTKELGAFYNTTYTLFRVWSPVSKQMYVVVDDKEYEMMYSSDGTYETKVMGNLVNLKYHYKFRINDEFINAIDPYALAYEPGFNDAYIIDLSSTYQMVNDYNFNHDIKDAIIEEISIRDLTSLVAKGTFIDAIDSVNTTYGLGYLKNIGFTHLQVMPVFGFGGVDELNKADYNWGYNPVMYFALSNTLASSHEPPCAINEFKMFVDTCHKLNLGVIVDVVYNHVYDASTFALSKLCPGYLFHVDKQGFLTNASGCGNDLNSTKYMVRKLIYDNIKHFINLYHVDGFRFDLMSLLDVDTLNEIANIVKTYDKKILLYGEGWNIPNALPSLMMGSSDNFWQLPDYAFFNDAFRNLLKCNFNTTEPGYVLGKKCNHLDLYHAFTGYAKGEIKFSDPKYSINFLECHDNHTVYDAMIKLNPLIKKEEVIDRLILGLGIILLSQGIPFFHLGYEFKRSKNMYHNSYNLSDEINGVNYQHLEEYKEVINSLKAFINLRCKYDIFKGNSNVYLDSTTGALKLRYQHLLTKEEYTLIVKNDYEEESLYFTPQTYLIFQYNKEVNEEVSVLRLNKPSIYLLKRN